MSECWTARSMDGRCCVAVSLCSLARRRCQFIANMGECTIAIGRPTTIAVAAPGWMGITRGQKEAVGYLYNRHLSGALKGLEVSTSCSED